MVIYVIDPIWSKVSPDGIRILQRFLYFKRTYWTPGPYRKMRKDYNYYLISKNGMFLTGFWSRVKTYLDRHNISYEYHNPNHYHFNSDSLPLPKDWTVQLRPEQEEARQLALMNSRGVIHYPTGSGKTIIYLSIIASLPNPNALILLHRQDLLYQTYNEAKNFFPDSVGIIGDGKVEPNRITIATIQTFSKLPPSQFHKEQTIVVIDEAHHVSSFDGMYYKTLTRIPAPIRLGFTATVPYSAEGKMALEGLIGPVIAKKRIQEVSHLAKPIIKLKKLPYSQDVHDLKTWKDVYKMGVVWNSRRHKTVLEDAIELGKHGITSLILVVEIQHGKNLLEMAKKRFPEFKIEFVWGQTPAEDRLAVKRLLETRQVNSVIANAVWREGIDIPSLGAVINAAGGKSEILTLQSIGRGLRTTPDKTDVILIDYFDPSHRFLIEHFGYRLSLYFEEGWL